MNSGLWQPRATTRPAPGPKRPETRSRQRFATHRAQTPRFDQSKRHMQAEETHSEQQGTVMVQCTVMMQGDTPSLTGTDIRQHTALSMRSRALPQGCHMWSCMGCGTAAQPSRLCKRLHSPARRTSAACCMAPHCSPACASDLGRPRHRAQQRA